MLHQSSRSHQETPQALCQCAVSSALYLHHMPGQFPLLACLGLQYPSFRPKSGAKGLLSILGLGKVLKSKCRLYGKSWELH